MPPKLSIVIPVYNEYDQLAGKVEVLSLWKNRFGDSIEIIILDSNSTDQSKKWLDVLSSRGLARVFQLILQPNQQRSIGLAVYQACNYAKAVTLLILPIDILITEKQIMQVLEMSPLHEQWGCFFKKYDTGSNLMKIYCYLQNRILTACFRQAVWTNVFFLRSELSHLIPTNGFLEDVQFSDRLKVISAGTIIPEPAIVSVRKYEYDGLIRRIFYNGVIILMYRFGYRNFAQLKELYAGRIGLWSLILKSFDS